MPRDEFQTCLALGLLVRLVTVVKPQLANDYLLKTCVIRVVVTMGAAGKSY